MSLHKDNIDTSTPYLDIIDMLSKVEEEKKGIADVIGLIICLCLKGQCYIMLHDYDRAIDICTEVYNELGKLKTSLELGSEKMIRTYVGTLSYVRMCVISPDCVYNDTTARQYVQYNGTDKSEFEQSIIELLMNYSIIPHEHNPLYYILSNEGVKVSFAHLYENINDEHGKNKV